MQSFVIVVDMQHDFIDASGALPVPGAEVIVAPAKAWLAALSPKHIAGVLFTYDTHVPAQYAGSPESEQFPLHCVRGTAGWENVLDIAALDPAIPAYRLEKGVFAMWEEPDIAIRDARRTEAPAVPRDRFFAELKGSGVAHVIVIGVAADFCVRWAIDGLIERGFAVTVPAQLTRGIARGIEQVVAEDFAGSAVTIEEEQLSATG